MAKVSIKFNNKQPLNESVYEKTPCKDKEAIDFIFKFLVDGDAAGQVRDSEKIEIVFRKNEVPKKIEDITNVVSKKIRSNRRLCKKNLNFMIRNKILEFLQDEKNEISPYCREQLRNQMEELNIVEVICGDTSSFEDFEQPTAEPETVTQPTQSGADEEDSIETRKSRVQPKLKPRKTRKVKTRKARVNTRKATVASDAEEKKDSPTDPPVEAPEVPDAKTTTGTTSVFRRRKKDD